MRLFIISIALLFTNSILAQGIEFFHGTWKEALELAKEQEKVLFVDGYATWCGPCKRMARTTFKDAEVGDFHNSNFINVKMDMESKEGRKFGSKYPVQAFPTLFYIDKNGKVLQKVKGAQPKKNILDLGRKVLAKVDYSQDLMKEYEAGKREPQLIYDLVKALNKSNKSSIKIANEYLRTQKDLSTDFNLKFILVAASQADSKNFERLIENRKKIENLTSKDEVAEQIEKACYNTVQKAIQFESEDLLIEAIEKAEENLPRIAKSFAIESKLSFYKAMNDAPNYVKTSKLYSKKMIAKNSKELMKLAGILANDFTYDKGAKKLAEKLAKSACKYEKNAQNYIGYVGILAKNGNKKEALSVAKKALKLDINPSEEKEINRIINHLKG